MTSSTFICVMSCKTYQTTYPCVCGRPMKSTQTLLLGALLQRNSEEMFTVTSNNSSDPCAFTVHGTNMNM